MRFLKLFILFSIVLSGCKTEEPQNPPTVITKVVSDVTLKNATLNGEVVDEGFSAASDRGFVYSEKNTNPSVSDSKVQSGYGKGVYSIVLDKLPVNTKYYYKAYATNTKGTSYGEVQSFTTADYKLPTAITDVPKNITYTTVELGGSVTDEGGGVVSESGFVVSTNASPTITDLKFTVTKGKAAIALIVSKLNVNTKYYVRSYAINEKGIVYGNEQSFTTLALTVPNITTTPISNISYNKAVSGGKITSNGGSEILSQGICWSTSPNPTVILSTKTIETKALDFTSNIVNLIASTKYYIRSYATNSVGTSYGNELTFSTIDAPTVNEQLKEDLMAYFPFNGNSNDESNFKNNAKNFGATLTTDRFNNSNKAYFFNGESNYLVAAGSNRYAATEFTLSYWIRYSSFNKISGASIALGDANSNIWMIGGGEGGIGLSYGVGCADGVFKSTTNKNFPISLNNWYHVLVVFKSDKYFLYINNELIGLTYFNPKNTNSCSTSNLYIGLDIFGLPEYFFGKMDDVGIWSRALSEEEIKYLYQNQFQVN